MKIIEFYKFNFLKENLTYFCKFVINTLHNFKKLLKALSLINIYIEEL